jgi:hypothetical protein
MRCAHFGLGRHCELVCGGVVWSLVAVTVSTHHGDRWTDRVGAVASDVVSPTSRPAARDFRCRAKYCQFRLDQGIVHRGACELRPSVHFSQQRQQYLAEPTVSSTGLGLHRLSAIGRLGERCYNPRHATQIAEND